MLISDYDRFLVRLTKYKDRVPYLSYFDKTTFLVSYDKYGYFCEGTLKLSNFRLK